MEDEEFLALPSSLFVSALRSVGGGDCFVGSPGGIEWKEEDKSTAVCTSIFSGGLRVLVVSAPLSTSFVASRFVLGKDSGS